MFYNQLLELFPEIEIQARYYREYRANIAGIEAEYPVTWAGIYKFINEKVDPRFRALAKKRVAQAQNTRQNKLAEGGNINYGGYPIYYIWKQVIGGNFKRALLPQSKLSKKDIHYEQQLEN